MREVEVNKHTYVIGTLDAFQQLKIVKRLAPSIASIRASVSAIPDDSKESVLEVLAEPIAKALASLSDEDSELIVRLCLGVCSRKTPSGLMPVQRANTIMFSDLDLFSMLGLAYNVIEDNLGSFFSTDQPSSGAPQVP
jgi:hypothetical protein